MVAKRQALPFEAPEGILFTLKDITYTPETPRKSEPFTVRGKVELFGIPFLAPIWVIAKVTAPEMWWEHYIPIWGSPTVGEGTFAIGGDFEIEFPRGFDREGEFTLEVEAHMGPTYTLDSITLPPFPPVASEKTTFIVAGEVPEEELGFRNFRIISYAKNGGAPVTPPGVLELDVGDRLQIKLGFEHRDLAVTGKIHAAIWQETLVDPHDEVLNKEKTFSVPASDDWEPHEEGIEIIITSDIAPGTEYGLYAKIMGITGGDIFTDYLGNVITIIGPPELGFDLTRPTVSETPVDPGTPIDITCPIKSTCSEPVDATAKVIIYEGSIAPGHGDKLKEYDSGVFHINPGVTQGVIIRNHVTVEGTIDRRDVEVEVYVGGRLIKQSEWDDVFYVTQPEELQTLEVDITPSEGGYVTTSPPADEGHPEERWYNNNTGKFEYDTRVRVTAHPNEGYKFDHWSDEIEGGVSYDNPEYVAGTMTEHRAVKAHFEEEVIEQFSLSVGVEPYGGGSVTASPSKTRYEKDERVMLTASPYSGYEFDYWSGDASGYSPTTYVYMDRDKSVVANFKKAIPPPTTKVSFTVKGDGFPFLTSKWQLYHYDQYGNIWQDYIQHNPGDIITVRNVQSAGRLSCHCASSITGEWSEQFYSREFAAIDGEDYKYDIASGIVYYR